MDEAIEEMLTRLEEYSGLVDLVCHLLIVVTCISKFILVVVQLWTVFSFIMYIRENVICVNFIKLRFAVTRVLVWARPCL